MATKVTPRSEDYSRWYTDVVQMADLADYSPVKGCMVIKPHGYALWENIKEAKEDEYRYFDFWGVAETDDHRHPWYGLSLFKRGFGGYSVDSLGVWDCPLSPRYLAVSAVEQVRKLLRYA